jgi:hypothetical protein
MWILDKPYKFGAEEMRLLPEEYNHMLQDVNLLHYDTIGSVKLLKTYIHIREQMLKNTPRN